MSKKFQVVEKEDFGTDWHQVRYNTQAMQRFDTEAEAEEAAGTYLTDVNCNNSLTKDEKRSGAEAFMMTKEGCFLGNLDGEAWFLTDRHDKVVTDRKYYELEGKTEVAVRPMPGT